MKRIRGIVIVLFASVCALGQHFDPAEYILHQATKDRPGREGSAVTAILKNKKGLDNSGVLKALEGLQADSLSGDERINYFLIKSFNYCRSAKYKSAIENSLLASRLSQKNGDTFHYELALLMQAEIYRSLGSHKNLAAVAQSGITDPNIAFQVKYLAAVAYLQVDDIDKCLSVCDQIKEKEISKFDRIQVLKLNGTALERQGKYKEAIDISTETDALITSVNGKPFGTYSNPALFYRDMDPNTIDRKLAYEQGVVKNNLGFLRLKSGEPEGANRDFDAALALARQNGFDKLEEQVEKNLALGYILTRQYGKAEQLLLSAEKISKQQNNRAELANLLCIRAKNQYLSNNIPKASDLCNASVEIAETIKDYSQLSQSYSVLAEINAYVGDIQKSNFYSRLADENAQKAVVKSSGKDADEMASTLKEEAANDVFAAEKSQLEMIQLKLEATRRHQEFEIIKRENQIKESNLLAQKLENERAQQNLLIVKRELETVNQQKELEEMKKDRLINILENKSNQVKIRLLNKQRKFDAEIKAQKEKDVELARKRERNLRMFLIISLAITGLIVFLLYRNIKNVRIIRSSNKKLEELSANLQVANVEIGNTLKEVSAKNEIIELKNHQILESITYAKRIQEASLPKADEIDRLSKENFVVYKPKDIISGDFYIVSSLKGGNNRDLDFYIVGDCTGHGVPGAMLSLLCSSLVRQSLAQPHLNSPARLLNDVNERLRNFFRHKEDDSFKDGMDIACCIVDRENKKMFFAGAGRPIVYLRNGEAVELKGEKHHIGFSTDKFEFEDHVVSLEKGDAIYLFTDGYTDQFNGKTRKRFMTKNLKELLVSLQGETMQRQGALVEAAFEEWRGDYVQMDDVCVMGIKI